MSQELAQDHPQPGDGKAEAAEQPQPEPAPSRPKRVVRSLLILVAVLLVISAGAYTSAYIVPAGYRGVVLRLGEYAGTAGPGLQLKIPFGVDRVKLVNAEATQTETFGFRRLHPGVRDRRARDPEHAGQAAMLTGDLSMIDVEWTVSYRCQDPAKYSFTVHDPVQNLRDSGEAAMRQVVGDSSLDYVLLNRGELARVCQETLQGSLDRIGAGIQVVDVRIQDIAPPEKLRDAFREVDGAQQEKDRLIQQALADYNREVPKARGEAGGLVAKAEGYALERVNRARGESAHFTELLREYRGAKEVTKKRLYLEACREVMPRARQVIVVDGKHKDLLPGLNLEKAGQAAGGGK